MMFLVSKSLFIYFFFFCINLIFLLCGFRKASGDIADTNPSTTLSLAAILLSLCDGSPWSFSILEIHPGSRVA